MAKRKNVTGNGDSAEDFGANAWLVDEMYKQYLVDKDSVDQAWWPVLEKYSTSSDAQAAQSSSPPAHARATPATSATHTPAPAASTIAPTSTSPEAAPAQQASRTTNAAPRQAPIPADAPRKSPVNVAEAPAEE